MEFEKKLPNLERFPQIYFYPGIKKSSAGNPECKSSEESTKVMSVIHCVCQAMYNREPQTYVGQSSFNRETRSFLKFLKIKGFLLKLASMAYWCLFVQNSVYRSVQNAIR